MEQDTPGSRIGGPESQAPPRKATSVNPGAERAPGGDSSPGRKSGGIPDRVMDPLAGGSGY